MFNKFKAFITLFASLLLATIAGWFSIAGLTALLAGSFWGAVAMGSSIELGKLAGVSWLYNHWKDRDWFRIPLLAMVFAAMLITSTGIFGYLAKSHGVQEAPMENAKAKIELIDQKIDRNKEIIERNETLLSRLDKELSVMDGEIEVLVEYSKINREEGSRATRASQQQSRDRIERLQEQAYAKIDKANDSIGELRIERIEDSQVIRDVEVEVAGIAAIAKLFDYHDSERLIYFFFVLIMFAFDPLAVVLLMAANKSLTEIYVTANESNSEDRLIGVSEGVEYSTPISDGKPELPVMGNVKETDKKDEDSSSSLKEEKKSEDDKKPKIKAKLLNHSKIKPKGWGVEIS